jgi:hypothetical protein
MLEMLRNIIKMGDNDTFYRVLECFGPKRINLLLYQACEARHTDAVKLLSIKTTPSGLSQAWYSMQDKDNSCALILKSEWNRRSLGADRLSIMGRSGS